MATRVYPILYFHETSQIAGAENSLIQLTKNLNRSYFKPVFILPEEGPLSCELEKTGVKIYFMALPRVRSGIGVLSSIAKLRKFVQEHNVSLIHSNSIRTHIYGIIAARLENLPTVWHERNLITTERIDPDAALSFMPDAIICNSNAIAKRFARKEKLPGRVVVIHNGVDLGIFNPMVNGSDTRARFGIMPDDIVIGIASRFNPTKGHETFFKSVRILLEDKTSFSKKIKFLVAGGAVFDVDKPRENYLKRLVEKEGLGEVVIFTGLCSDMPRIYSSMDIVVLASDAEPCGRVISEAMAMGKAVIATNTGGTPEIVEDNLTGILVRPRDPYGLASSLKKLIENEKLRIDMGAEGRKRAIKLLDIKKSALSTEELYFKLLKGYEKP